MSVESRCELKVANGVALNAVEPSWHDDQLGLGVLRNVFSSTINKAFYHIPVSYLDHEKSIWERWEVVVVLNAALVEDKVHLHEKI